MAEQNNELLMKNHESRPTKATPFSEANVVYFQTIMVVVIVEEGVITLFVVIIIQILGKQMMIIKGRLHKIRTLKVVKIFTFVMV